MSTDSRRDRVKAPMLVGIVVALHVAALGTFLFIQGCGTTSQKSAVVEPPPAPVMPPAEQQGTATAIATRPSLQPPVTIEPAPAIVEPAAGQTYKVQSGDSLSKIAARVGVSSREIAELNNIKDPNKIRIGQQLLLPSYASNVPASTEAKPKKAASTPKKKTPKADQPPAVAGSGEYIVKSGDSLSKIASRQGTTVKALREVNNLKGDMLKIGQKLVLPAAATASTEPAPAPEAPAPEAPAPEATPAPAPEAASVVEPAPAQPEIESAPAGGTPGVDTPFEYEVKAGETLDDVASKFAVLKQDIVVLNGITDEASVTAGTKVKIPLSAP